MKRASGLLIPAAFPAILHAQLMGPRRAAIRQQAGASSPTSVTDNFVRADSNPMSVNMSDGVGVWEPSTGSRNACKIVSNTLTASAALSCCNVVSPSFGSDQWAEIVFDDVAVPRFAGAAARLQSTSDASGYMVFATLGTSITIQKLTNTTETVLGAAITVDSIQRGETLRIEVTGEGTVTIEAFLRGSSIGSRTDSTSPYSGGSPGAFISNTATYLKGFSGGSL